VKTGFGIRAVLIPIGFTADRFAARTMVVIAAFMAGMAVGSWLAMQ